MCCDCSEIEINTGDNGYNGYSPELAVSEDCAGKSVLQLISWVNGTGEKPSFGSDIMTDAWLLANPIYLGEDGFTDDCAEATDITGASGASGSTGATGEQGATGEAGTDGCDPEITITAQVSGSEPYDVTVTREDDPLSNCFPEYNFEFPLEMITENTAVTEAIDDAVTAALAGTSGYSLITSIGDSGTTNSIRYTPNNPGDTLSYYTSGGNINYVAWKILGKNMIINFEVSLLASNSEFYELELLIPNSETAAVARESAAVSIWGPASSIYYRTPVITTNTDNNIYLLIGFPDYSANATVKPILINSTIPTVIQGQINITIN